MLLKKFSLLASVWQVVSKRNYSGFSEKCFTDVEFDFMDSFNQDSPACEIHGQNISRSDYQNHVMNLARGLWAYGIKEGQGVITLVEDDIFEHGPLILALMKIRAFAYNLRPEVSLERIIEEKSRDPRTAESDFLIISESLFLEKGKELLQFFKKIIVLNWNGSKPECVNELSFPETEIIWPHLIETKGRQIKLPSIKYNLLDTAVVTSTSGSTAVAGENKGVVLSNRALISALCQMVYFAGTKGYLVKAGTRFLARSPYSIIAMLCITYFVPLAAGMTLVYDKELNSSNIAQKLSEHKIGSCFNSGPEWEQIDFLIKQKKVGDLSSLRFAYFGGAGTSPKILQSLNKGLRKCGVRGQIMPCYGTSEISATGASLGKSYRLRDSEKQLVSSGFLFKGNSIVIKDEKGNLITEPNKRGFIYFNSISMMDGYYGRPEETARVLSEEKEYYTGDIGFFDKNKEIHVLGREKEKVINRDNNKIYLFDISNSIYKKYRNLISRIHILEDESGLVLCMIPAEKSDVSNNLGKEICKYTSESFNISVSGFNFMEYFPVSRARKLDKKNMLETQIKFL